MKTFLALCNDLERESGTVSTSAFLTDVVSAGGRQLKIVGWVNQAWMDIQTARPDWAWMREEFDNVILPNQKRYTAEDFDLQDDFSNWIGDQHDDDSSYYPITIFDPIAGQADETELREIPFNQWRALYDRGVPAALRPTVYAISTKRELCIAQGPDKVYAIRGEYRKRATPLVANTDVPAMPEEFQSLIVWRALEMLGEHDGDPVTIARGRQNFRSRYVAFINEYTGKLRG